MAVFDYVYLFSPGRKEANDKQRYTFVMMAGNRPLETDKLNQARDELGYKEEVTQKYSDNMLRQLVEGQGSALVLTDDYAPVDNLMAGVFSGY